MPSQQQVHLFEDELQEYTTVSAALLEGKKKIEGSRTER